MRKNGFLIYRSLGAILLLSINLSTISPASAASVTDGVCSSTVTSNTSVSIKSSAGYCYIAFAASGSNGWTAPTGVSSAAILLIAGGGAGGAGAWGGGGGAGGVVYYSNFSLTPGTNYSLNVGSGGAAGAANLTASTNRSNDGENTWFSASASYFAVGGGAGASYAYNTSGTYQNGNNGGSGGGATEHGSGGSGGTASQSPIGSPLIYGNNGGNTAAAGNQAGGGGGGAGSVGVANTSSGVSGNGGAGINTYSSFTDVFATPFSVGGYIAGGGGGGSSTTAGTASGGGGAGGGSSSRNGTSGTANTGGGGGGASYSGGSYAAGAGGKGLLIIRFSPPDLTAPTFTSSTSFLIPENISTSIAAATINVSESATVTISGGVDASDFNIYISDSTTALIKFKVSPNYEAPDDVGLDNIYNLTLTATDPSNNVGTQNITITVTDVLDTSYFNSLTLSGAANYRQVLTISANVSVAAKVTFRAKNIIISGCKNKLTSGSSPNIVATCTWKPSFRGSVVITAIAAPTTVGISGSSAAPLAVVVGNRSGNRL